ncbi:MAG: tyrosine-protein phosphatase [Actinomycetota bacterium]
MTESNEERSIPFERWWNVRDLGGLPTRSGDDTRPGVLVRAASPAYATSADIDHARRLGLTTFVDLRLPGHAPDWRDGAPDVATVDVNLVGSLTRPPDGSVEQMLRLLLDGCRVEVARAVDTITRLALQSPPVVFHCHTGKDRTGLIAIIMLSLASVPETVIVTDYLASNPGFEAMRAALIAEGVPEFMPGAPAAFQAPVSPSGAEAALAFLEEAGGVAAYLESGGLADAAIERAASLLV